MILEIGDWIFDVDMTATMEYSATEALEHCLCCYCRNFYGSVDERYPGLRPFLAGFGVDVEAPDELMPFFPPSECVAFYAVSGRILQEGQGPLLADDLAIYPQS